MRNAYIWLLQLVTGVLIAVFLGIHLVLQHLNAVLSFFGVDVADSTAWASMIGRANQGIFVALYIALLVVGLYHGINGLRNIILETTPSVKVKNIVTWSFIVLGIGVFAWATYVPIALFTS